METLILVPERSPPLKTGATLTIFESSGNISFSGDKSNINFKETYNSPKHFSTTLYCYSFNILVDVLSHYSCEIARLYQK